MGCKTRDLGRLKEVSPPVPPLAVEEPFSFTSTDSALFAPGQALTGPGSVAALPARQRLSFASQNAAAACLPAPVVPFPSLASLPAFSYSQRDTHRSVRVTAQPFHQELVTSAAHLLLLLTHPSLRARETHTQSACVCVGSTTGECAPRKGPSAWCPRLAKLLCV